MAKVSGVSLEWLATGEGGIRKDDTGDTKENQLLAEGSKYAMIPAFDVSASAGDGAIAWDEAQVGEFPFRLDYLKGELRARVGSLAMIAVEGDSMYPTLSPGDQIMVDRSDTEIMGGDGIYVVRLGDSLMVKRLQRLPGGTIEVVSDNQAYRLFSVVATDLPDDFSILGRVVWYGKWV